MRFLLSKLRIFLFFPTPYLSQPPGFRGGAFRSEGRLQHGIIGQHRLLEVAAQRPRPALLQHIAGALQRQAAHIPVIVGAQPCHQLADGRLFLTGQLSGHSYRGTCCIIVS